MPLPLNPCVRAEDAARPGWIVSKLRGKLRDVKRPACFSIADRRVSKLRPWLSVSRASGMRNRSERKTHSDQLAWEEAQGALRSRCPTDEAINLSHRTNAQRMERSPARRTGVLRVKDQRQTSPDGRGPRTKDQCQTPSIRPALVAKDQRQLRSGQHSLVGDSKVNPCNRDHAPRFLWSETLEKAKQCVHYYRNRNPM